MVTRFRLNGSFIDIATNSAVTHTQDSTLDTVAFDSAFTSNGNPYLPMSPFEIVTVDEENNDTIVDIEPFVVIADQVERVSKTKDLFIHHVTATQKTRELSKHILRNSIFRQAEQNVVAKTNIMGSLCWYGEGEDSDWAWDKVFPFSNDLESWRPVAYIGEGYVFKKTKITSARLYIKSYDNTFNDCEGTGVYNAPRGWQTDNWKQVTVRISLAYYETGYEIEGETITINKSQCQTDENGDLYFDITSSDLFEEHDINCIYRVIPFDDAEEESNLKMNLDAIQKPDGANTGSGYILPTICRFEFELRIVEYKYSLYDVLETIIEQSKKTYNNESTYNPCYMPTIESGFDAGGGAFLNSVVAPDFVLTGKDLYSAIAEVMSFIDAIPTLSADGMLGYEFLNDNSAGLIEVDIADEKKMLNEEHFANKMLTKYQEGKTENGKYYPSTGGFAPSGSKKLGIMTIDDPIIFVDEPIDYIEKVDFYTGNAYWNIRLEGDVCEIYYAEYVNIWNSTPILYKNFYMPKKYLDFTPSVFRNDMATLLPDGNPNTSYPNQRNVAVYSKGDNYIDIGKLVMTSSGSQTEALKWSLRGAMAVWLGWFDIEDDNEPLWTAGYFADVDNYIDTAQVAYTARWRVKYHGVYDGQVTSETIENKNENATIESSVDSSGVDLERLGVNMEGLTNKLVNENLNISLGIKDYRNRVKKGSWIEYNGSRYVANVVKTTFTTKENVVTQEVQFVKNFNEISKFINLAHQKMYYEIDNQLSTKGYENVTEFVYFTSVQSDITKATINSNTALTTAGLGTMVAGTFKPTGFTNTADYCVLSVYRDVEDQSYINLGLVNELSDNSYPRIEIPFHAYAFGNQICFEASFENEINARYRCDYHYSGSNIDIKGLPTLYTDKDGYADMFSFSFKTDSSYGTNSPYYPLIAGSSPETVIDINKYHYFKRANEILHFNFQIAFLPMPIRETAGSDPIDYRQIFFGDYFAKNSGILHNNIENNLKVKKFRLYYSYDANDRYSINDKKGSGSYTPITSVVWLSEGNGVYSITFTIATPLGLGVDNWSVCDEEGNIYISSNEPDAISGVSIKLYVVSSRNRV